MLTSQKVVQRPSPHFNERPKNRDVCLLVIHNISLPPGEFNNGCIERFFCGHLDSSEHPYFESICDLQVSSHYLIKRTGEVIQFVDCDKRAWHAGESCWRQLENCNDFSIGIELEGTDDLPYEKVQYEQLVLLTRDLQINYPLIEDDHIVGHCDIAPKRKTDPGPAFDWQYYRKLLSEAASK